MTAARPQHLKSWVALALVSVLALATGYTLPRPGRRGGDMLDAVAAVQRRSPQFLVSEPMPRAPMPRANWVQSGTLYLCRTPRTPEELDGLSKFPSRPHPRWAGVVCFRGTAEPGQVYIPWVSEGGDRCLDYGDFAVFGDPEMLQEVGAILAAEGFQLARDPR
jgi:hypothetical protein